MQREAGVVTGGRREEAKGSSTVVKGERQRVRKGFQRFHQRSVKRSEWNRKGYTGGILEDTSCGGWGRWTDTVSQDDVAETAEPG